jgi:hypothetical protein
MKSDTETPIVISSRRKCLTITREITILCVASLRSVGKLCFAGL